jgi:glycosyltransferase involved in cell wall biosynthesis
MKILAIVSKYPPLHNAGAEWMLHEILKYLIGHGHEARVLLPMSELQEYEFEGVKVCKDVFRTSREYIKNSDIIFTHLERAGKALNLAEYYHKPYVEVVHNTNRHGAIFNKWKKPEKFMYVIYNSDFTKNMNYPCPGIVVRPPVDAKRYKVVRKGNKLTLINLFWRKGGLFFQHLARLMPDRDFLGVEGSYGKQEKDVNIANIEYIENTSDIRKIYAQTRILLMPSVYESYGRTALEAMVSGIPVIASPTPGLKESLGEAGIFCGDDVHEWVEAIKKLDEPEEYKRISKLSTERFKEVSEQTGKELEAVEKFLFDIIMKRI